MRVINKKYLLIILLVGVILIGVIVLKPNKKVQLDNVILKQEVNNKTLAMYVGRDNNYEEYNGNTFPKGYRLNTIESKCIDNNGEEIKDALQEEGGSITLTTNKSSYCYLYFDEKENLSNICDGSKMEECMSNEDKLNKIKTIENLSSETKGGMYRYQGQAIDVDNNYICFGTSDKDKCVSDTDHYMYRIIGIEESGRIKVIKKEALNRTYTWGNNKDDDIKWPDSLVYQAINGDDFLKNTNYIPKGWEEKIVNKEWLYGDMWAAYTRNGLSNYLIEIGQNKALWHEKSDNNGRITKNEVWTSKKTSQVNLMYLSDYYYSVSDGATCVYDENNFEICQTSWIHLSQNDKDMAHLDEYLSTRLGYRGTEGDNTLWIETIYARGYVLGDYSYCAVRPVFYIDASETLIGGLGTIENPFIIKS